MKTMDGRLPSASSLHPHVTCRTAHDDDAVVIDDNRASGGMLNSQFLPHSSSS
jgi:hypothetical protein